MFAKERVARFLKQGGPDAVLAQIDRLDDSSYVRRVYYTELLKQAELSERAAHTRPAARGRRAQVRLRQRTLLTAIAKRRTPPTRIASASPAPPRTSAATTTSAGR